MDMEAEWARVVSAQSAARKSLASEMGGRGTCHRSVTPPPAGVRMRSPQMRRAGPIRAHGRVRVGRMRWTAFFRLCGRLCWLALPVALVGGPLGVAGDARGDFVTVAAPRLGASAVSHASWVWPLGQPRQVARGFLAPATRYGAGHRGIDIRASPSEDIRAPSDGVVSFAGSVAGRPVLSISHPGDLISSLEPVLATVSRGDSVSAGMSIGSVANGGHCDGSCVHFGVRLHGEYVSPLLYLAGVPRAVLLPLGGPDG